MVGFHAHTISTTLLRSRACPGSWGSSWQPLSIGFRRQRQALATGNLCFPPLNPFFPPGPSSSTLHLSFCTLSTFFIHPRTFFFDPGPFLFQPPSFAWCVGGWLACCNANQISTAFGEDTGLCGFGCLVVGCLEGYKCKASIDSIW